MTRTTRLVVATLAAFAVGVAAADPETTKPEATMTARGTFEVKMTPQPDDAGAGRPFARYFGDKKFSGDLDATGMGYMLASGGPPSESGAYVALEQVTGTLNGKRGSFVLVHKGTMSKGQYHMDVTVSPDSGTEELSGISGTMKIIIEGAKHSYEFTYTLGR